MWQTVLPPSSPAPAAVVTCPLLWRAVLPRLQKVSANRARGLDQDCTHGRLCLSRGLSHY